MEKHPSILVIDDEQVVCDSCYRILSNEDYQVYTNTNPVEGYQKALNNNYDLLLLDLCMDKMDGIQLLKKLRHIKSDMPVMIITGYPSKETKEESTNLGVLNYISKPFQPSEIVEPIKNFFEQKIIPSKGLIHKGKEEFQPKILVFSTDKISDPGIDLAGLLKIHYPPSVYTISVPCSAGIKPKWILNAFEKGFDGVFIAADGTDCPYSPTCTQRTGEIVSHTQNLLKQKGIKPARLKMAAICSVCAEAFAKYMKIFSKELIELEKIEELNIISSTWN